LLLSLIWESLSDDIIKTNLSAGLMATATAIVATAMAMTTVSDFSLTPDSLGTTGNNGSK